MGVAAHRSIATNAPVLWSDMVEEFSRASGKAALSAMDLHDRWNIYAIGGLNCAHIAWWVGLLRGRAALDALFFADIGYITCDFAWISLVSGAVPQTARPTLLVHHALTIACAPVAFGQPLLMSHLLRCWIVELQSWNHIAMRQLESPRLRRICQAINTPLFCATRLLGFPLTYLVYARQRSSSAQYLLEAPRRIHVPLSIAHLAMYGLMCFWGYRMVGQRRARQAGRSP